MKTHSVELSDEQAAQLSQLAGGVQATPAELLKALAMEKISEGLDRDKLAELWPELRTRHLHHTGRKARAEESGLD